MRSAESRIPPCGRVVFEVFRNDERVGVVESIGFKGCGFGEGEY